MLDDDDFEGLLLISGSGCKGASASTGAALAEPSPIREGDVGRPLPLAGAEGLPCLLLESGGIVIAWISEKVRFVAAVSRYSPYLPSTEKL